MNWYLPTTVAALVSAVILFVAFVTQAVGISDRLANGLWVVPLFVAVFRTIPFGIMFERLIKCRKQPACCSSSVEVYLSTVSSMFFFTTIIGMTLLSARGKTDEETIALFYDGILITSYNAFFVELFAYFILSRMNGLQLERYTEMDTTTCRVPVSLEVLNASGRLEDASHND